MLTKLSSVSLTALFFVAIPIICADQRKIVTLKAPANGTVADLLCSEQNGQIDFNLPTVPQFTQRSWYQALPTGMSEYPALYKTASGVITTAAMLRFLEQGHKLFTNKKEQNEYTATVKACIDAHKEWYAKKNGPNSMMPLIAFRLTEGKVFSFLKRLSLTNRETRNQLEKILSTPNDISLINKIVNAYYVPSRAWIETTSEPMIRVSGLPATLGKQLLTSSSVGLIIALAGGGYILHNRNKSNIYYTITTNKGASKARKQCSYKLSDWKSNSHAKTALVNQITMVIGLSIQATILNAFESARKGWTTDFKLTPEPSHGIKVVIELTHPESR